MKKIKQVFPSRNYITIDSFGDVEVIFNPVGDGFEGDDKLMFRKGRWAFRVNDFLSGRVMPDGSKEAMGRKVYSLNLVYDDKDGEPIVNTTYVDPTSVIPLDGSIVDVVGSEKLAQEDTVQTLAKETTVQTLAKETTVQTLAKEETLLNLVNSLSLVSSLGVSRLKKINPFNSSGSYYLSLPPGSFVVEKSGVGYFCKSVCLIQCTFSTANSAVSCFGDMLTFNLLDNEPVLNSVSYFKSQVNKISIFSFS